MIRILSLSRSSLFRYISTNRYCNIMFFIISNITQRYIITLLMQALIRNKATIFPINLFCRYLYICIESGIIFVIGEVDLCFFRNWVKNLRNRTENLRTCTLYSEEVAVLDILFALFVSLLLIYFFFVFAGNILIHLARCLKIMKLVIRSRSKQLYPALTNIYVI